MWAENCYRFALCRCLTLVKMPDTHENCSLFSATAGQRWGKKTEGVVSCDKDWELSGGSGKALCWAVWRASSSELGEVSALGFYCKIWLTFVARVISLGWYFRNGVSCTADRNGQEAGSKCQSGTQPSSVCSNPILTCYWRKPFTQGLPGADGDCRKPPGLDLYYFWSWKLSFWQWLAQRELHLCVSASCLAKLVGHQEGSRAQGLAGVRPAGQRGCCQQLHQLWCEGKHCWTERALLFSSYSWAWFNLDPVLEMLHLSLMKSLLLGMSSDVYYCYSLIWYSGKRNGLILYLCTFYPIISCLYS